MRSGLIGSASNLLADGTVDTNAHPEKGVVLPVDVTNIKVSEIKKVRLS